METKIKKEKAITAGAVILLIASLIGTGIFYNSNKLLTKNLNDEKLKTEMMLSEKLTVQREIDNFRNQITSLSGINSELDKVLASTTLRLNQKEEEVIREKSNMNKIKKHLSELTQMKIDFENKVLALNESLKKLKLEKDLQDETIASLQEENKQLSENLAILSSMTADNYLVETAKRNIFGNEKLTVMARRTKKMTMNFRVPENMVENISFKLTKPDGSLIEGKEQGLAYTVVNDDEGLLASTSTEQIKVSKKIEMTYMPKEKLKSGIYKIEMFNGEKYIGACNIKLR